MKKSLLIISGIIILLVGLIIGLVLGNYIAYKKIQNQFPELNLSRVKTEISPEYINKITSLNPNQELFGIATFKGSNQFGFDAYVANPETGETQTVFVNIPVASNDEIIRFKQASDGKMESVSASFDELKVDDYLTIKILPDKKIIYLPTL